MTRGMNRDGDPGEVADLVRGDLAAHRVEPLGVVNELLRQYERLAERVHHPADVIAQRVMGQQLAADLLVVAERGSAVDDREPPEAWAAAKFRIATAACAAGLDVADA